MSKEVVSIVTTITPELARNLRLESAYRGVTMRDIVEQAIAEFLAKNGTAAIKALAVTGPDQT